MPKNSSRFQVAHVIILRIREMICANWIDAHLQMSFSLIFFTEIMDIAAMLSIRHSAIPWQSLFSCL
jgi:hypothetical protein